MEEIKKAEMEEDGTERILRRMRKRWRSRRKRK